MKKILIAVVILALGGGLAYRLHANKQKNAEEVAIVAQQEAQVAVRAAKVAQENVSDLFSANGTFVAAQDLNVSSEMGGQIVQIYVKEGDFVREGQVLARTKADRTNVQLENAKAVLETAKADLKRFESAYQTGGVTAQQLEQVRLQLSNAQANYNSAAIVSVSVLGFTCTLSPTCRRLTWASSTVILSLRLSIFTTLKRVCPAPTMAPSSTCLLLTIPLILLFTAVSPETIAAAL